VWKPLLKQLGRLILGAGWHVCMAHMPGFGQRHAQYQKRLCGLRISATNLFGNLRRAGKVAAGQRAASLCQCPVETTNVPCRQPPGSWCQSFSFRSSFA